ncbi:MAG: roadblock/LC7 domain-containing protein [Pseudomonadota bacterium]|nr:roadblock/LC7 domain-containing protein [Pseudomonadota bacterium]
MSSSEQDIGQAIKPILKRLNNVSNDIEASSVMTRDGISLASVMRDSIDQDRLGAMCASLLSLGAKTSSELERGNLKQVLIEGENGCVLVVQIGARAVLAIVSRPSSKLGMVFNEARKIAREIEQTNLV